MRDALTGDLSAIQAVAVLHLAESERLTGRLVLGPDEVHFRDGQLVRASAERQQGLEAVRRLISRSAGTFRFQLDPEVDEEPVGSLASVLMQALRVDDEWAQIRARHLGRSQIAPEQAPHPALTRIWPYLDGRRPLAEVVARLRVSICGAIDPLKTAVEQGQLVDRASPDVERADKAEAAARRALAREAAKEKAATTRKKAMATLKRRAPDAEPEELLYTDSGPMTPLPQSEPPARAPDAPHVPYPTAAPRPVAEPAAVPGFGSAPAAVVAAPAPAAAVAPNPAPASDGRPAWAPRENRVGSRNGAIVRPGITHGPSGLSYSELVQQAQDHLEAERWAQAESLLEEALSLKPHDKVVTFVLARVRASRAGADPAAVTPNTANRKLPWL